MSLKFHNSRLTFFISHDLGYTNFEENIHTNFHKLRIFNETPVLKYKKLSDIVYDEEFIKISAATPTFKIDLTDNSSFLIYLNKFINDLTKELSKEQASEKN